MTQSFKLRRLAFQWRARPPPTLGSATLLNLNAFALPAVSHTLHWHDGHKSPAAPIRRAGRTMGFVQILGKVPTERRVYGPGDRDCDRACSLAVASSLPLLVTRCHPGRSAAMATASRRRRKKVIRAVQSYYKLQVR